MSNIYEGVLIKKYIWETIDDDIRNLKNILKILLLIEI